MLPSIPTPILDETGLVIPTYMEVFNGYVEGEKAIFGVETNYETNSPDGQRVGIISQATTDTNEVLQSLFNSFFGDFAQGNALNMVVGRKGLLRQSGTFSTINLSITTNSICTLTGLDFNIDNVNGSGYTVQDNAGNQWILISTTTLLANTTTSLIFRARNYGEILATSNTITLPVTIVVGVVSVTNPAGVLTTGILEETDTNLRVRYFQSFAFTSRNQIDAVYSQLQNLTGVTDVLTVQNNTPVTDANGTPLFTLWTIIEGGNDTAIANIIYQNIHGGGMRGAVSVPILAANNITTINVKFDRPIYTPLHVKFNLKQINPSFTFNILAIKNYIVINIIYTLGQNADTGTLTALALKAIIAAGGGGVPLDLMILNDNSAWVDYVAVATLQHKFTLSASNIAITIV